MPRSSFLLPSQSAGPDLIFVLRNDSSRPVKRLVWPSRYVPIPIYVLKLTSAGLQSKVVQNLGIDDKNLDTLDPDQWYRGSQKTYERGEYIQKLHDLKMNTKPGEEIEYLSILLAAASTNLDTDTIIGDLIEKKKNLQFAQDIVIKVQIRRNAAKIRLRRQRTTANQTKFNSTQLDLRKAKGLRDYIQPTDYYAKILTHESVEPFFGPIFTRILRGMKDMTEK